MVSSAALAHTTDNVKMLFKGGRQTRETAAKRGVDKTRLASVRSGSMNFGTGTRVGKNQGIAGKFARSTSQEREVKDRGHIDANASGVSLRNDSEQPKGVANFTLEGLAEIMIAEQEENLRRREADQLIKKKCAAIWAAHASSKET
ncbi:hypothetical protein V7S43_004785 [Phytophthora oleae]|uniref:Uncharacterized protein n=1 Tax=Phytophthora oleae TaxID=2107226 RepID=A0ABD3FXT6_9STRA